MRITKEEIKALKPCADGYAKHRKGEASVNAVRELLRKMGFAVTAPRDVSANGPDIGVFKGKHVFRIEVKTVVLSKRALRVSKVTRSSDDFVALVFPSGQIHFDPMRTHLAECGEDGVRYVTMLGQLYA